MEECSGDQLLRLPLVALIDSQSSFMMRLKIQKEEQLLSEIVVFQNQTFIVIVFYQKMVHPDQIGLIVVEVSVTTLWIHTSSYVIPD